MRDITVALGVGNNIKLLRSFYVTFREHHPDVPLSFGALQLETETVEYIKSLQRNDELLTVAYGNPVDGHHVSFSENFNAAINGVKTSKLVLGHTDIIFCDNFFDVLEKEMSDQDFYIYTTVEPPIYIGHRRPGKTIGEFGKSFGSFDYNRFEDYVKVLQSKPDLHRRGYSFFLAGYKKCFEDVGGYDMLTFSPAFCEDDDFCIRVRMKGYHMVVLDHAIAYHFVSQTVRSSIQRMPSFSEIQMNRKFAKKWGFEARFLWETHYEQVEKLVKVYDIHISCIGISEKDLEKIKPLLREDTTTKTDIELNLQGSFEFESFARLVGSLRLKDLKKGTYRVNNYVIKVNNDIETCFVDNNNYLLMQKEIKYE